jgi:hypothetical protein
VEPESAVIENSKLNSEWMLLILLGEMRVTQGNPGAGYSMIFEAARKSGDEAVYKRSVEVALAGALGTVSARERQSLEKSPSQIARSQQLCVADSNCLEPNS